MLTKRWLSSSIFLGLALAVSIEEYVRLETGTHTKVSTTPVEAINDESTSEPAKPRYTQSVFVIRSAFQLKSLTKKQPLFHSIKYEPNSRLFMRYKEEQGEKLIESMRYYTPQYCYALRQDKLHKMPVKRVTKRVHGKVQKNFYRTAQRAAVPLSVLKECVSGLQGTRFGSGDQYDILYDGIMLPNGDVFDTQLKYIAVGAKFQAYRFKTTDNTKCFVDRQGQSLMPTKLYKPIMARYRLSSGFGMRLHPITHRLAFHQGIDFAAPAGTPVHAVASGRVEKATDHWGHYGRAIQIKHEGSSYATRYAHLSRIIVKPGMRIAQGQVIGYVGSSGRSTNNHLHFEILHHNRAIDPRKIMSFKSSKLQGAEYLRFMRYKADVNWQVNNISAEA